MSLREWTGTASTAEAAVKKGLKALDLPEDRVEIEVLGQKTSGLFSLFGFKRVEVRITEKPAPRRDYFDDDRRWDRDRDRGRHGRGRREDRDDRGGRREDRGRDDRGRGARGGDDRNRGDQREDRRDEGRRPQGGRSEAREAPRRDDRREEGRRDDRRRDAAPPREDRRDEGRPARPIPETGGLLAEWKVLLGWDDLSWTVETPEGGDVRVTFAAAGADRLTAQDDAVLAALEHLVNTVRSAADRAAPRVRFAIEGRVETPRADETDGPRREGRRGRGDDRRDGRRGDRRDGRRDEPAADVDEQTLTEQALHAADEVKRTGSSYRMDPMPAPARRVVHQVLADHPDVETASEGEGPYRKVVVRPRAKRVR